MHESGALSDDAYRGARARLMQSVADADLADGAADARRAAVPAAVGGGAVVMLGAAALAAVAMLGATPAALAWICLAALATVAVAACWQA
jgi:hypothetical protein